MRVGATKGFKQPRAAVLACYRDPARYEAVLQGLGAHVARTAGPPRMAWACAMIWRGERRVFEIETVETTLDQTIKIVMTSALALAEITLDFRDLPDGGCRITGCADLTARTIAAKLALQSLRLVRGKAENRLERFITAMGRP